ncbi:hypothetical protein DRP07_08170 [Archaeoglobales archaeon]|nr:MAG: hypothetical protein DRP07_08170 [Archaeoglobales archaeon]
MTIDVRLPKEVELTIKKDKTLEDIIRRKIEHEISKEIKEGLFLSMLFDELLEESKLSDKDVDIIDRKVKEGIVERLGWK